MPMKFGQGLPPFKAPQSVSPEKSNAVLANSDKRVFAYSMEEWFRAGMNRAPPESLRHDFLYSGEYVAPKHLLLGLMREADSDAARLLAAQGLTVSPDTMDEARSTIPLTDSC
jgi:hypothetical protein